MKRILNGLGVVVFSAALLVAGGCGNDAKQPTGQVVKGPVNGAVVTNANGGTSTTDANGRFTLSDGPYTSTGGRYFDLATNTEKNAPNMSAPKFARNITALTTLISKNPTLQAKIESLGISYDDALTTVSATNKDAIALNECVGAALAALTTAGASQTELDAFLTKLAAEVETKTVAGEVSAADIAATVNDALTATTFTTAAVVNAKSSIATQITTTGTKVGALQPGTTLTGATGGGSGGLSQN